LRIVSIRTRDVRFPTSREMDGSDAMNPEPDYSAAYVELITDSDAQLTGSGFVFTIGRGNDVEVAAIKAFERPVFGTCAGMIVLDRNHLGLVDVEVRRNAFGRQVASFETDLDVAGEDGPVHAVFIRAPWIEDVGPDVEVLAEVEGRPVLAREGRFLVASFHPELTDDTRLHQRFLDLVREDALVRA